MRYANLGATGLQVSRICLGMMTYGSSQWRDWVFDYEDSLPFVELAIESGINFFDTADMYSQGASEEVLGRAIDDLGVDREDMVIATKCFGGIFDRPKRNRWGLSRKHIIEACDASLARLNTDYIDLYQIHRFDRRTPIEETIDALTDLVRAGKVRYIGASSMYAWQLAKYLFTADARGAVRFTSMQNHYNLLYREDERELIPLCVDQGVGLIPWSPQARGWLARSADRIRATTRGTSDNFADSFYANVEIGIVERNAEVAERLDVAPSQVALSWLLSRPGVVAPIVGASKLDHLRQAIEAVELDLPEAESQYLEELYRPQPVSGH